MGTKRKIITFLDRPGSRWLLEYLATKELRKATSNPNAKIFFDQFWMSYDGDVYSCDGRFFRYYRESIAKTTDRIRMHDTLARDYWFHVYKPMKGDAILDVGAGVGSEILTFARSVGDRGHILSIEAHPNTFQQLSQTCKYNKLTNVSPVNVAVGDKRGKVCISNLENHEANSIRLNSFGGPIVDMKTIDQLVEERGIEKYTFIKMNIEGAERQAILGMEKTIRNVRFATIACHDFLADELGDDFFRTRAVVLEFFTRNGFKTLVRDSDPRPYVRDHVHAWRA